MLKETTAKVAPNIKRHSSFPSTHWKHIFKLLGLVVVADGKVHKEEVDAYLDVIMELRAVVDPSVVITRHMAKSWLMHNKAELTAIIDSLAYDTAIIETLAPIKSFPHKLDVITSMVKVAIADGVYENIEQGFIKKTILYWNISAKDGRDLETKDEIMVSVNL